MISSTDKLETLQDLLPRFEKCAKRPAVLVFTKDGHERYSFAKLV